MRNYQNIFQVMGLITLFITTLSVRAISSIDKKNYNKEISHYVSSIKRSGESPIDYIIKLFSKHDFVIICERMHPETTQWDFIYELTSDPRFIKSVGHIFTEYGSVYLQPKLNDFMNSPKLNEKKLIEIFNNFGIWPVWTNTNFYTYLKKLYQLNKNLSNEQEVKLFFSDIPWKWENMTKFEYRTYINTVVPSRDKIMANAIIQELIKILKSNSNKKKALIIMNYRHAFGKIRDKKGDWGNNVGTYLFRKFGNKVANVMLNSLIFTKNENQLIHDGKWDAAFSVFDNQPIAIDFSDTNFGKDKFDYSSQYNHLRYQDVFNGLIFYKPLAEHTKSDGIPYQFHDEQIKEKILKRIEIFPEDLRGFAGKIEKFKRIVEFSSLNPTFMEIRKIHAHKTSLINQIEQWLEP